MNRAAWKRLIVKCTKEVGTYQRSFDAVITTLADILEKRDNAQELFDAEGGQVIVEHTNKGGATNVEQNPLLRLINDLNRDALQYWRDLGLTPAGLKRIRDSAMQKPKVSALALALKELG